MGFTEIILIVLLGLVLILAEVFIIPGTTIVGIAGGLIMGVGIFLSYKFLGDTEGTIILSISLTISGLLLYLSFKLKLWERFSVKHELKGKVNTISEKDLKIGDNGKTRSAIRPMGTADFNNQIVEVSSLGGLIEAGTEIKIIKINGNKIFVEQIK